MRTFVCIAIFLCFPYENCQNQTTHHHTTEGRRGTRLPNHREAAAVQQQYVQTDHPTQGGGGAGPGTYMSQVPLPHPLGRVVGLHILLLSCSCPYLWATAAAADPLK